MSQSIYADFGVTNGIISGELSEHEENMISQPIDVRDGDDAISFNIEEEAQIEVTQHEVEEPEVDRIDINTETGEINSEGEEEETSDQEQQQEENIEFPDVDGTELSTVGAQMAEAMTGQEALVAEAIEKGLDASLVDVMKHEYETEGKLSESSYEALAAVGYSKTFVDSYMMAQQAVADKFVASVVGYAGGQEAFNKLSEHMSLNDSLTEAFNNAIERNDVTTVKALLDSAKTSLRQSFGVKPQRDLTKAAKPAASAPVANKVEPFANRDEMVKAMRDPRYSRDADYRRKVEARVAASF